MTTRQIVICSGSLLIAAIILGIAFYAGRRTEHTIKVTGYASKGFESDIVKWNLTITSNTSLVAIADGYKNLKRQVNSLIEILTEKGINASDITIQPPSVNPIWGEGRQIGYAIRQSFFVITTNIAKVESLARNPDFIYEKEILLESSCLEYNYTLIDELKKELLAVATKDARNRAQEIARSAGARLGKIVSARQGVFQITEPYSTEVSDYGIYSTATKNKEIKVTVSASFVIR
ncbi:MAG: SIMPL domain-containing protein [bacterium]